MLGADQQGSQPPPAGGQSPAHAPSLPELYHDPRSLAADPGKRSSQHANSGAVDRRAALVTSTTFAEAAQTRNIEVGALIRCERFAARLADPFARLVAAGVLRMLAGG